MNRKKRGNDGGGASEWLNTYADMVTLLLTFFAVLLSMSTVNQEKFNAFIQSFSNLPPEQIEEIINAGTNPEKLDDATMPTPEQVAEAMDQLYQKLLNYVQDNGMESAISLHKNEGTIFIRFDSSVFFEPDKYVMREGGYNTLAFIGDGLKEYEIMIKMIAICGHTATVPDTQNDLISDWMLSGERAAVVAMFLEDEKKIDPQKILLLGYGKNLPIADNTTEEGRMENRRVELAVVGVGSDISFDPYAGLSDLYNFSGSVNTSDSSENSNSDTSTSSETQTSTEKPSGVQEGVSPFD